MTTLKDRIRDAIVEYRDTPFDETHRIRSIPDEEVLVEMICEVIKENAS